MIRDKSIPNNNEKIPNKFIINDNGIHTKYYIFYRKNNGFYDLRCRERKCKGTAKYII